MMAEQQADVEIAAPIHRIRIPDWALGLQRQRGASTAALKGIDPSRLALLVVDMQHGFVAPGAAMEITYARGIVPPINRLADAFRQAGATVCWVQTNFRDEARSWSVWFSQRLNPDASARVIDTLSPGNPGYELYGELSVQATDLFCVKTRFSPFIEGASDLHVVLRNRGIDTLAITGTVSNTCCESTARDAMMLNYRTLFLSDANAARTDEEHNATLGNMVQVFAEVASSDEVIAALG